MSKLLWHEPSNYLAVADLEIGRSLPLITILDDDVKMINPFYAYPLSVLKHSGWVDLGEL